MLQFIFRFSLTHCNFRATVLNNNNNNTDNDNVYSAVLETSRIAKTVYGFVCRVLLKPRPHQQQCRSNIVQCYKSNDSFDKAETN